MRMPTHFENQTLLGQIDISQIEFDLYSRDEITKLLRGFQYIYTHKDICDKVFEELEKIIPAGVDKNNGRPGMSLWEILILGTLRLSCNWDYDKLNDIANNHKRLRLMFGINEFNHDLNYRLQTLKDNVKLMTPEVLERINKIIVDATHDKINLKKKDLMGQCDSFVVETNVHFPTAANLLFDAIRKVITLIACCYFRNGINGWSNFKYIIRKIKRLYRAIQQIKKSKVKDEAKKEKKEKKLKKAYAKYLEEIRQYLNKVHESLEILVNTGKIKENLYNEIEKYINHAKVQIDQIERRVFNGERIAHEEKIFSIFEEHTEWISKGKAGVPQELGLRVCILKDQFGLILHHKVMQKLTDEKITIEMVEKTKNKYSNLIGCSFDKGFYTPENVKELKKIVSIVILPKKGKLSEEEKEEQTSRKFIKLKFKHSSVESSINALENHGLDICPDKGIDGFKRYVAIAIVARNIQILGNVVQREELLQLQRKQKLKKTA